MSRLMKSYSELIRLVTLKDRFDYLKIKGSVGEESFGFNRYLNQALYHSKEWLSVRDKVIVRDNGCDLGVEEFPIMGSILIHHINPITEEDILNRDPIIFDQNNLICVSHLTHNAIHFSDESLLPSLLTERTKGDTCPWK